MLDTHPPNIIKMLNTLLFGKKTHNLNLFRRGNVLVGGKMIGHQHYQIRIKNPIESETFKLPDRHRGSYIVAEGQINFYTNQIAGCYFCLAGFCCQDFLHHCCSTLPDLFCVHIMSSFCKLLSPFLR